MSVHTKFDTAKFETVDLKTAKADPARRTTRTRVLMVASLVTCEGSQRVRIRDFSSKGAQVVLEGGNLTKCDVLLKRGDLCAAAQVVWIKGDEVGLTFYREISAKDLASN
jgi:hypothetical protein